ncbi:MAG TPA: tetratricopeptide repeat protein [Armatimonadota bacterium]
MDPEAIGTAFSSTVTWAALGLMIAIPIMKVVHLWLIEKVWEGGTTIAVLVGMIALLTLIMHVFGNGGAFGYIFLLIIATVLSPIIEDRSERKRLREMRNEDMARYERALTFDPNNAAAHGLLADAYVERGRLEEATTEYERAIALDPERSAGERYKLRKIQAQLAGAVRKPIRVCEQCSFETPADEAVCRRCGARLYLGFFAWIIQPENLKSVLKQSGIIMLVFLVLGITFSTLPLEIKGCVLMGTLIVGGYYGLRALGGNN